jgi:hypothetical protein
MPHALTLLRLATLASPQPANPRARDLGVPFEGAGDRTIEALPHATLTALLTKYGR